jgi:CHAT domain-containing protein
VAAAVPGSLRLLESQATAAHLLELMPRARWVHLAAHGDHAPYAPALQSIYVAGQPLRAHQIWGQDLSAVDVVTLSACDTALGRLDVLDNLRGLTAAFLVAGVGAVVASLWPVNAGPAATFYRAFYEALAAGSGPVEAFGLAQRATRSQWPQHRHWGAFTFIGGERN